jgi:RhoGAP domain
MEHLSRVASHTDKNKMDAKNLAIVFSPVVFGEEEISQGDLLSVQSTKVRYISYLFSDAYSYRTL